MLFHSASGSQPIWTPLGDSGALWKRALSRSAIKHQIRCILFKSWFSSLLSDTWKPPRQEALKFLAQGLWCDRTLLERFSLPRRPSECHVCRCRPRYRGWPHALITDGGWIAATDCKFWLHTTDGGHIVLHCSAINLADDYSTRDQSNSKNPGCCWDFQHVMFRPTENCFPNESPQMQRFLPPKTLSFVQRCLFSPSLLIYSFYLFDFILPLLLFPCHVCAHMRVNYLRCVCPCVCAPVSFGDCSVDYVSDVGDGVTSLLMK